MIDPSLKLILENVFKLVGSGVSDAFLGQDEIISIISIVITSASFINDLNNLKDLDISPFFNLKFESPEQIHDETLEILKELSKGDNQIIKSVCHILTPLFNKSFTLLGDWISAIVPAFGRLMVTGITASILNSSSNERYEKLKNLWYDIPEDSRKYFTDKEELNKFLQKVVLELMNILRKASGLSERSYDEEYNKSKRSLPQPQIKSQEIQQVKSQEIQPQVKSQEIQPQVKSQEIQQPNESVEQNQDIQGNYKQNQQEITQYGGGLFNNTKEKLKSGLKTISSPLEHLAVSIGKPVAHIGLSVVKDVGGKLIEKQQEEMVRVLSPTMGVLHTIGVDSIVINQFSKILNQKFIDQKNTRLNSNH